MCQWGRFPLAHLDIPARSSYNMHDARRLLDKVKAKHMRVRNDQKARRITACIMIVMVLFIMLFSECFIASHADHDCSGEDCPICACIHQCESMLRGFGSTLLGFVVLICPPLCVLASIFLFARFCARITPVSQKVRMNN